MHFWQCRDMPSVGLPSCTRSARRCSSQARQRCECCTEDASRSTARCRTQRLPAHAPTACARSSGSLEPADKVTYRRLSTRPAQRFGRVHPKKMSQRAEPRGDAAAPDTWPAALHGKGRLSRRLARQQRRLEAGDAAPRPAPKLLELHCLASWRSCEGRRLVSVSLGSARAAPMRVIAAHRRQHWARSGHRDEGNNAQPRPGWAAQDPSPRAGRVHILLLASGRRIEGANRGRSRQPCRRRRDESGFTGAPRPPQAVTRLALGRAAPARSPARPLRGHAALRCACVAGSSAQKRPPARRCPTSSHCARGERSRPRATDGPRADATQAGWVRQQGCTVRRDDDVPGTLLSPHGALETACSLDRCIVDPLYATHSAPHAQQPYEQRAEFHIEAMRLFCHDKICHR